MSVLIRTITAEDPRIIRALRKCRNVEIVAFVADADELEAQMPKLRPDVAVIDLALPRLHGSAGIARVHEAAPQCRLLVVTAQHADELVVPMVRAGAAGYLQKDMVRHELCEAIEALARGDVYYDERAVRVLAAGLADNPDSLAT